MKTFLFALVLMISGAAMGQDFYVLQVKGKVKSLQSGKEIKTNDVIKADEQLSFSTSTDAVAVVNAKTGRFVLKPGKPNKQNEFLTYVKDALNQSSSRLSTRAGTHFSNVIDFKTYFDKTIYLLPEQRYQASRSSYPISNDSFFFIQYTYKGEQVNKKLSGTVDNEIFIDREELFKVDGQAINLTDVTKLYLHYYSNSASSELTALAFNVTDPETVKQEVAVLQRALTSANTATDKIKQEIAAYLEENYGKVEVDNVAKWLGIK